MSTEQLERRTIRRTERLDNSVNGNPRFRFYFTDGSEAVLSSDASFGYEAENPEYRPGRTVDVSFTRAGKVEYMRPVKGRFALVVVVEAEDSEAAWQMVADGLHAEAEDSAVVYVGAPWEGVPNWDGLITDGITLGAADAEPPDARVELIPCD